MICRREPSPAMIQVKTPPSGQKLDKSNKRKPKIAEAWQFILAHKSPDMMMGVGAAAQSSVYHTG